MVNSRNKGARGEREFCDWLEKTFNLDIKPQRNLEQVRSGGYDVLLKPFIFEVKRVEILNKKRWWLQVINASKDIINCIPVVAYKQNRKKWAFLISAVYINLDAGYIELNEQTFIQWASNICATHEEKG
jgi:hypothetical protein